VYDHAADTYDFFAILWNRIAGDEATRHFRALVHQHVRTGALVLDAGTGTGRSISLVLSETQPRRVIGVDLSTGMLAQARKKLTDPRVELLQADATRLPFPDNTFDVVTSMWMLETLPDPLAAVRELLRVIRPEGIVLTTFSTFPSGLVPWVRAVLLELVIKPFFAGHFLTKQEQPLHACTMHCMHRYEHGLATIVTYGKHCEMAALALPRGNTSPGSEAKVSSAFTIAGRTLTLVRLTAIIREGIQRAREHQLLDFTRRPIQSTTVRQQKKEGVPWTRSRRRRHTHPRL